MTQPPDTLRCLLKRAAAQMVFARHRMRHDSARGPSLATKTARLSALVSSPPPRGPRAILRRH
eukprot:5588579-Alexandrium_andersonii.AAC.1